MYFGYFCNSTSVNAVMQQIFLPKWVFYYFFIVAQIYQPQASEPQNQETIEGAAMDTVDWPGLLADLRDSWQSPISYLRKRGYLPPVNDNLLEEKLNELRAMKVNEPKENSNLDLFSEKGIENVGAETNAASASSLGSTTNDIKPPNVLSASKTDIEHANLNNAIVTYASQQQNAPESIDNLFKDLSNDVQPNSDAELDQEFDEDSDGFRNNIANACAKKPSTSGSKSKSKPAHKCKSKSKSQSQPKSKPGFFTRLKQKLSSMFTKSKAVDPKKPPIKKPALSVDYANYVVKYLAPHRDMTTGYNTLSVNDLNGEYAGINSYGDWERGEKGLYRRDHSASKGKNLSGKEASLRSIESNELEDVAAGAKDAPLKVFPFNDFIFGNLNVKKLMTKDTSSQVDDTKLADLQSFNSKDAELNKIVHSLAEQRPTEKDTNSIKSEKSDSKDDFNLKELSFSKNSGSTLQDNSSFKDKTAKDSSLKELVPNMDETFVGNTAKNTEATSNKEISANDDLGDLTMSSFNVKNADVSAKVNTHKGLHINDLDFSIPDLPEWGWKSLAPSPPLKVALSKDTGAKDFGNLGMPSLKLKILESNAEQAAAAPASAEAQDESDQPPVHGFDTESNDLGVSAGYSRDRNVNVRQDMPNMSGKSANENPNHVAFKETNIKHFEIGELNTKMDDNNLDLDRQFTRQVLEKVLRSSAQNSERDKR
ncbi:PREDICTED: uncharacterized protein LOC108354019 [Rhagoletis zephyria]|uniref:uncharacterized protein LOC108354019 n=1 Tax=Rhagoletis zephyria TaxID=28612 RepID=UPI00081147CA|nr:PREDICTED: uncharacterized protein LOC108354019 [Rhagoletis zephyria]